MSRGFMYEDRVSNYTGGDDLLLQVSENDGHVGIGLALDAEGEDVRMCALSLAEAKALQAALVEAIDRAKP